MTDPKPVTDERLQQLQESAQAIGDLETAERATRALAGIFADRLECERIIFEQEERAKLI